VVRAYPGPPGGYAEQVQRTDSRGNERYRSTVRRIQLSGEMFEDRFVTTVRDLVLEDYGDHTVTFLIEDEEVGSVPVFIEAGLGVDPKVASEETFKKALTKGEILWLAVPQPRPARRRWRDRKKPVKTEHAQAVWFVYDGGKVYVLNGPREQQVPGLERAERVTLIARSKDHRSEVSRVPARVRVVEDGRSRVRPDALATEEPMEIRLHRPGQQPEPLVVTMRTPGADFELAEQFTPGAVQPRLIGWIGFVIHDEVRA
jgi:hypothetical protein